jgi:REP element-mobilizing transposase RayT
MLPASARAAIALLETDVGTLSLLVVFEQGRPMGKAKRLRAAGVYHLAVRSSTPDLLFRDGQDRLALIGQLERVTLDTDWTCIAVCLMGTHYHLLVEAGENVVPLAMQRINWAYAVAHNKRHRRRGHRVGGPYMSIPIVTDDHLVACYRYIVRNPVEEGLCRGPENWPWSSYASTLGDSSVFPFVDSSLVLDVLDPAGGASAIQRLRGLVETPSVNYSSAIPVAFQ